MDESEKERSVRLGAGMRRIRKARGLTLEQVAEAAQTKHGPLSQYERGERNPSLTMLGKIADALGVDASAFWLDEADPTAPDPEPAEDRVAGDDRGLFRSLPLHTFARADGLIDGSLAIDVIKRPTGKSGEVLKRQHNQRGVRGLKTEHISIEGVPQGAELVRVEEPIRLRDVGDELIPKGHLLIVDRERKPTPGALVLAVKNVDARVSEELPEVRLFRYHQAGRGWTLGAIDGTDATFGSGDGWEIVAAVLWWRSPP